MVRLQAGPFVQGIKAGLPLWLGAAPFAVAYALAARKAGLSIFETQLMSLTVYSGAAQLSVVQALSGDASLPAILLTALALNLHHFLYGVSLARRIEFSTLSRVLISYFLTDGTYAVTIAAGARANLSWLFGAALSLFLVWNVFTASGMLIGHLLVIPAGAHLDFVPPLTFFVLLISLLRTRPELIVAVVSALGAAVCLTLHLGSATILIVGVAGALFGAALAGRQSKPDPTTLKGDSL